MTGIGGGIAAVGTGKPFGPKSVDTIALLARVYCLESMIAVASAPPGHVEVYQD